MQQSSRDVSTMAFCASGWPEQSSDCNLFSFIVFFFFYIYEALYPGRIVCWTCSMLLTTPQSLDMTVGDNAKFTSNSAANLPSHFPTSPIAADRRDTTPARPPQTPNLRVPFASNGLLQAALNLRSPSTVAFPLYPNSAIFDPSAAAIASFGNIEGFLGIRRPT